MPLERGEGVGLITWGWEVRTHPTQEAWRSEWVRRLLCVQSIHQDGHMLGDVNGDAGGLLGGLFGHGVAPAGLVVPTQLLP